MTAPIFAPIASQVLGPVNNWANVGNTVVGWVVAPILAGVTIMVIWHGLNVMRGAGGNLHLVDVFMKTLRAFLVMSLALVNGAYASNVKAFFLELRTELSNLFVSAPAGTSSYQVLDTSVGKAIDAMQSMMPWVADNTSIWSGNFTGLIGLVCMAFMVGCIVIYAMISAVNLLLIDFALTIVWAVGPLFVACFAFEATAKFFDTWLGAVLKYTFTAVVIAAVLAIGNGILEGYCNKISANIAIIDFLAAAFSALGATGILIFLAFRAPDIAVDIVGGISLAILSPAAAKAPLAEAGGAMKSGARAGANAAAYGAGAAAKSAPATALKNTSLGQRAIAAGQSAGRFAKATANMKSGSVGAAYAAGRGSPAAKGPGSFGGANMASYSFAYGGRPLTPPTR